MSTGRGISPFPDAVSFQSRYRPPRPFVPISNGDLVICDFRKPVQGECSLVAEPFKYKAKSYSTPEHLSFTPLYTPLPRTTMAASDTVSVMDDFASTEEGMNSNSKATDCVDSLPDNTLPSSNLLGELEVDDTGTLYSYYSTWSTNYTMSNLPGPGRNLGNFFSWAGSTLEERLARLMNRGTERYYEDAVNKLLDKEWYLHVFQRDICKEHDRACDMLLLCAKYI